MNIPSVAQNKLNARMGDMLMQMGANPDLLGYRYLKECIIIVLQKRGRITSIINELYNVTAEKYCVTLGNVERAIRHTITSMWNKGKIDAINKCLQLNIFTKFDKPTNGQFIMILAEKLSREFFYTDEGELTCL